MPSLDGTVAVIRLILRRDRVRLTTWMLALTGVVLGSAAALVPLYPDQPSIERYVTLFGDNPAVVAFAGPGHGFDDPNIGVILVNEVQLLACIGIALMAVFLVNRHTRAEEDAGRTELLRSNVVGRHASIAAILGVVAAAVVVLAVLCAVGFVVLGFGATGSIALAASFAGCGLAFAGLTASLAQLAGSGRTTLGLAIASLGVAFATRAIGDITQSWLRWFSPIGWAQAVRAYADERWWPVGLCLGAAILSVVAAFWLATRRDLGAGLLQPRLGPARAGRWARRPVGIVARMQRATIAAWMVGLTSIGAVYGSIGRDVEQIAEDNEAFADLIASIDGAAPTDAFLTTATAIQALLAAGFAISAVLRIRTEEVRGRAEPILAGPVSRSRWAWSHLVVAATGTVLVIAAGGVGLGTGYAAVSGDLKQIPRLTGAALAAVPAVLVLVGVALALFGLSPRLAPAAWALLGVVIAVELLGELLGLPTWTRTISPLDHAPALPVERLHLLPLAGLTMTAVLAASVGIVRFRSRDIQVG